MPPRDDGKKNFYRQKPKEHLPAQLDKLTDVWPILEYIGDKWQFQRTEQGLSFCIPPDVIVLDLDHCIDPLTKQMDGWAQTIVDQLPTYWEYSWSGEGLHGYVFADAQHRLPREKYPQKRQRDRKAAIEMFFPGSIILLTNNHVPGTPLCITHLQTELERLYSELGQTPKKRTNHKLAIVQNNEIPPPLTVPEKAVYVACSDRYGLRFTALWLGTSWQETYSHDHSRADIALCRLLYNVSGDTAIVDSMFRKSGLMRPKWDEKRGDATYGINTLGKLVEENQGYANTLAMSGILHEIKIRCN